jgi:hypothetical protein
MANNERVSQLLELFEVELQPNDIFLMTDTSQHESKKLEVGQLLLFIENNGTFYAYHAITADTASYVASSNIDGIVNVATIASSSISASWAQNAGLALWANTASWAQNAVMANVATAQTASYLLYSSTHGSASYAMNAKQADTASLAAKLFFNGQPNGTSSWSQTASVSISSSIASASWASVSSSFAQSASWASSSVVAQTASFFTNQASFIYRGPTFISPIQFYNSIASTSGWATFDCTLYVPAGTQVVILDYWVQSANTNILAFIYVRANSLSSQYVLGSFLSAGGGDNVSVGGQGSVPLDQTALPTLTFQYNVTEASEHAGTNIRLIGYY